jgi:hypothetical protein
VTTTPVVLKGQEEDRSNRMDSITIRNLLVCVWVRSSCPDDINVRRRKALTSLPKARYEAQSSSGVASLAAAPAASRPGGRVTR